MNFNKTIAFIILGIIVLCVSAIIGYFKKKFKKNKTEAVDLESIERAEKINDEEMNNLIKKLEEGNKE